MKGRGNFCTIIYDIEKSCVLKLIKGRSYNDLKPYFDSLSKEEAEQVEYCTMDMFRGFIKIATGNSKTTFNEQAD